MKVLLVHYIYHVNIYNRNALLIILLKMLCNQKERNCQWLGIKESITVREWGDYKWWNYLCMDWHFCLSIGLKSKKVKVKKRKKQESRWERERLNSVDNTWISKMSCVTITMKFVIIAYKSKKKKKIEELISLINELQNLIKPLKTTMPTIEKPLSINQTTSQ